VLVACQRESVLPLPARIEDLRVSAQVAEFMPIRGLKRVKIFQRVALFSASSPVHDEAHNLLHGAPRTRSYINMDKRILMVGLLLPCSLGLAATQAANDDADFAAKAADGGMAEVITGQLAAQKASDPQLRMFGQRMVTDHSKANDELKQIASRDKITLPDQPGLKHKEMTSKLGKMDGAEFDKAYTQEMIKDHEEDVALFKKEAEDGKNPDLKMYAQKTLPTLQEHLEMIRKISTGGSAMSSKP
jgi:putative membrane protein